MLQIYDFWNIWPVCNCSSEKVHSNHEDIYHRTFSHWVPGLRAWTLSPSALIPWVSSSKLLAFMPACVSLLPNAQLQTQDFYIGVWQHLKLRSTSPPQHPALPSPPCSQLLATSSFQLLRLKTPALTLFLLLHLTLLWLTNPASKTLRIFQNLVTCHISIATTHPQSSLAWMTAMAPDCSLLHSLQSIPNRSQSSC